MSDSAADIPAQRLDSNDTVSNSAVGTAAVPAGSALDRAKTAAGDAADKASDIAKDAADKVGTFAGEAADKVGALASETADKVGVFANEAADKVGDAVEKAVDASGKIAAHVIDRIRNNAEVMEERGSTTIANEVVEKIAGIAARSVKGVYDLGGDVARVLTQVREKVGLGEGEADQGVSVVLTGTQAAVKLVLVIEYGYVVYTITEQVRTQVIAAVEHLLGLEVTSVDIVVDDVHVADVAAAAAVPTA